MRAKDFDRLYEEHAGRLYSFLAYRTGDRALAEDLLADTFERAIRARDSYDRRRGAGSWLYAIALNLLRDHARREAAAERALARTRATSVAPPEEGELRSVEDRDALTRAMERLSDDEREAIALRYGADLTLAQIGQLLEIPAKAAEARVYRALRKLRHELSEG